MNYASYLTSSRNRAHAGMLSPALEREPLAILSLNWSMVMRWRPTSTSVPTTALTMLRRKRLADMRKCQASSASFVHAASVTLQSVVFTSVWVLLEKPL